MKIKLLLLLILINFITLMFSFSQENNDTNRIIKFKSLMIGKLTLGNGTGDIHPSKIDAALNLAALLSKKYLLIPQTIRDSVSDLLTIDSARPSLLRVADTLKADNILFLRVDKIFNMIRIEITSVSVDSPGIKSTGEGYALIHHNEQNEKQLLDPALLEATQRAFAVAVKDSNMYVNANDGFRVFPSETIVIGGIEYVDNPSFLPKWDLFEYSVISSYDAVESIFAEARKTSKYIVYDIPTRDTIYALFNLYIVENYRPPSREEIDALDKFGVKNYISGKLIRMKDSCSVELMFYKIIDGRLKFVKSEKDNLKKDNIDDLRIVLKNLVKKLLEIESPD